MGTIEEYRWYDFSRITEGETYCGKTESFLLTIKNIQRGKRKFTIKFDFQFYVRDPSISWSYKAGDEEPELINENEKNEREIKLEIDGNLQKELVLSIITPKGGFQDDTLKCKISVRSEDGVNSSSEEFELKLTSVIVAVKTNVGKEFEVARSIVNEDEKDTEERRAINPEAKREIMAIMAPFELKGYFYLETMHPDRIPYIARKIRNFKGVVNGIISINDIADKLTPKPAVSGLDPGSFVELVKGPFKGEKAKILNVDKEKEEVTVQFIESAMLIPVKVRAEDLRLIESGN
ncbi:transcription elongation factor Spt5 [Caldiplasma sukawensis]